MATAVDDLLTPDEAKCYLLYHRTPGLTLAEIGHKIGKSPGHVSRIRSTAEAKVKQLKELCSAAGGDPTVVDSCLFQAEAAQARA